MSTCPNSFREDGISLISTAPRLKEQLGLHMRRVLLARQREGGFGRRYLSKNNANIARIPAITSAFPESIVPIPLRDPLDHARSLLRQHRRFTEAHQIDSFARQYMADIGHFEFGALHRPILFPEWDRQKEYGPDSLTYWLHYWRAAYSHLATADGVSFVDFSTLSNAGALEALFDAASLPHDDVALAAGRAMVRAVAPVEPEDVPGEREARELYEAIRRDSVCITSAS